MNRTHICTFSGERMPPLESYPEYQPMTGMVVGRDDEGAPCMKEITVTPKPPRYPRCEMTVGRGQCTKKSVGGARYAWGCVALCSKHLDEECGPEATKEPA